MKIFCPSLAIPAGKIFAYRTRLVEAHRPGIMEFGLPGDYKEEYDIEVVTRQDSTNFFGFKPNNFLKALYQSKARPIVMENSNIFDSRYETDGNIAHIMTNVISKILVCQKFYSDITVVLRSNASKMSRELYKTLGIDTIYTDRAVQGNLLIPNTPNWQGSYEPLYPELFGNLMFSNYSEQTPERIFIARKGKRRLINEDEVATMLKGYGFQKFYFEDISIAQQWSLCRNAKVVVGMHGAALANLTLNRNKFRLVELFHPGYVVNMYRNITYIMGGKWVGVAGQITPDLIEKLDFEQQARAFALSSTKIDLTSLEMALDYLGVSNTNLV